MQEYEYPLKFSTSENIKYLFENNLFNWNYKFFIENIVDKVKM